MYHKNSILGSCEPQSAEQATDPDLFLNDESSTPAESHTNGREHLNRRARVQRNRKYDESSFYVDYSGNRNKIIKNSELDLKQQASSSSRKYN